METPNNTEALKVNIILIALGTDKQELADEIGVDRALVSKALAGRQRAIRTRRKLVRALCNRMEKLIIPEEEIEEETDAKAT